MSELDKWAKRKCYPVALPSGDTGYVTKMTLGQLREQSKLDPDQKTVFILACCVVNEDGTPVAPRDKGEQLVDYVNRANELLYNFGQDNITTAMQAIRDVSTPPAADEQVKN